MELSNALNTGIIGAGLMGKWHAYYANQLKLNLVAVIDTHLEDAQQLASQYSNVQAYDNLGKAIEFESIQVIHICTPLATHFELAKFALERGLHVVSEKPLGIDAAETQILLALAKQKKLLICPVHQFNWQSGLQSVLSNNDFGDIFKIEFITCSAGGESYKQAQLGEVVADILPHPLSLFHTLQPQLKLAELQWQGCSSRLGECDIRTEKNGVSLSIYVSLNARPTRCEMHIYASRGKLTLNFFHGYVIKEYGKVTRLQKIIQPLKFSAQLFFISSYHLIKRFIKGELAYPGLKNLFESAYNTITEQSFGAEYYDQILDVAISRDQIKKQFLAIPSQENKTSCE